MKKETIIGLVLITLAICFFVFGPTYIPEQIYSTIIVFLAGWQLGSWANELAKYLSEKF